MIYYPPPHNVLLGPYRTILGRFSNNEIRVRPGPTHPPTSKVTLDFFGELDLLVIKISFFLDFSCFCTFYAENYPGTTQKKWQQCFSCLEM